MQFKYKQTGFLNKVYLHREYKPSGLLARFPSPAESVQTTGSSQHTQPSPRQLPSPSSPSDTPSLPMPQDSTRVWCAGSSPGAPSGHRGTLDRRSPGGGRPLRVLPVPLEQLVQQRLVGVAARADERRQRVPLQLDHRHLSAVQPVPVGDLQQPRVAARVRLEAGRQHLEQLVDEVLLLRGGTLRPGTAPGRDPGVWGWAVLTVSQKSAMRMARSSLSPRLA